MSKGRQLRRQWSLLRALAAARRGLTAAELRDLVDDGVTIRTIYRDLEQLCEVGFQIVQEDNRYRLHRGDTGSNTIPIRESEQLALILAERMLAPLGDTWFGEALTTLRRRLMATMTPIRRAYVEDLCKTLATSHTGQGSYEAFGPVIAAVQEAIATEHVLEIVYARPGQPPQTRHIEPLASWYRGGRLYVVAFCRTRQAIRTFAVHRFHDARLLDETFDRDPAFDAEAFTRRGFGVLHGPIYDFEIDLDPRIAHLPRELTYHPSQRVRALPDGGVRLSFTSAGLPEVAAWVCSFGGKMRPISPPELVERCRDLYRAGLESLADRAPTSQ